MIKGIAKANRVINENTKSTHSLAKMGMKTDKHNLIPNKPITPKATFSKCGILLSKSINLVVANLMARMPINTPKQIVRKSSVKATAEKMLSILNTISINSIITTIDQKGVKNGILNVE